MKKGLAKLLLFLSILYILLFLGNLFILLISNFYFLDEENISVAYAVGCIPCTIYVLSYGEVHRGVFTEAIDEKMFDFMQKLTEVEHQNSFIGEMLDEDRKALIDQIKEARTKIIIFTLNLFILLLLALKSKIIRIHKLLKPIAYWCIVFIKHSKYYIKYFMHSIKSNSYIQKQLKYFKKLRKRFFKYLKKLKKKLFKYLKRYLD